MAFLLNRVAASRIECLHALMIFIVKEIGSYKPFSLTSVKFKRNTPNIHKYCSVLITHPTGLKYCPFKQNPLDDSGCGLTNGYDPVYDTTKSKEVSNTINALHGLGFLKRNGKTVTLLPAGIKFANCKYGTAAMQNCILEAVLHYGPVVGALKEIITNYKVGQSFNPTDIFVGYPETLEQVKFKGQNITISIGSQTDSDTRTRSCIFGWLTTAGILRPEKLPPLNQGELAHLKYKDFLRSNSRTVHRYVLVCNPFANKSQPLITEQPLDYMNLTKRIGALREHNQDLCREASTAYAPQVKNRRLAICYLLDLAYRSSKTIPVRIFLSLFQSYPKLFLVSTANLESTIQSELDIAKTCGIPFDVLMQNGEPFLKPFCGINLAELTKDAPAQVLSILSKITL